MICNVGDGGCQYALDVGMPEHKCVICVYHACQDCGEALTSTEVEFYGDTCDRCERDWNEHMERLRCRLVAKT